MGVIKLKKEGVYVQMPYAYIVHFTVMAKLHRGNNTQGKTAITNDYYRSEPGLLALNCEVLFGNSISYVCCVGPFHLPCFMSFSEPSPRKPWS